MWPTRSERESLRLSISSRISFGSAHGERASVSIGSLPGWMAFATGSAVCRARTRGLVRIPSKFGFCSAIPRAVERIFRFAPAVRARSSSGIPGPPLSAFACRRSQISIGCLRFMGCGLRNIPEPPPELGKQVRGGPPAPGQRGVIHLEKPESGPESLQPLEVVQERPVEVALDRGPRLNAMGEDERVLVQEGTAQRVVLRRDAVLGH